VCQALERHRLLALVLPLLVDHLSGVRHDAVVLEVAPSKSLQRVMRALPQASYRSIDAYPDADGRMVDEIADLTSLPDEDGSVDLLVVSHVLEHIPDDGRALAEMFRVMSPPGLAVLAVPQVDHRATDEDPQATDAERVQRFGQADHVRLYGHDLVGRISKAGFSFVRFKSSDLFAPNLMNVLGLRDEAMWLLARSGDHSGAAFRLLARSASDRGANAIASSLLLGTS
jgi:SAM-dependent methyltransferase